MPTQETSLRMQRREEVIDPGNPLRHSVVVGVFGLEEKFEKPSVSAGKQTLRGSIKAAIRPNPPECRVPIGDQPQAGVTIRQSRVRSPKDDPHEVIIEKRRANAELGFL